MSSNSRSNAVLAAFSTAGIIVVVVVVSTFVLRIVTVQIEVGLGTG